MPRFLPCVETFNLLLRHKQKCKQATNNEHSRCVQYTYFCFHSHSQDSTRMVSTRNRILSPAFLCLVAIAPRNYVPAHAFSVRCQLKIRPMGLNHYTAPVISPTHGRERHSVRLSVMKTNTADEDLDEVETKNTIETGKCQLSILICVSNELQRDEFKIQDVVLNYSLF